MQLAAVVERVERVVTTCGSPDATRTDVAAAMAASAQVRAFLDARDAELCRMLDAPGSFPEQTIAESTRCSLSDAGKQRERADTLDAAASFADRLDNGEITARHVDALTRAGKRLDDDQRARLLDDHEALADRATRSTVAEFDTLLRKKVNELQADDGMERLERQRRAARLSSWVDNEGMWNLRGRFDPVTGKDLAATIRTTTEALFAAATPDTAPDDPIDKQRHLEALALTRLIRGDAPTNTMGRSEAIVVVDTSQSDGAGGPVFDWGIPVEIPHQVLATLLGDHDPHIVVVANGIVLHAPGELDLGRTTRLANRAQRRALRGLYATCAIPGCATHYDRCKLHHVIWWRHGGRTDLDNLLPVCTHHHTKIHHHGWTVSLGAQRDLTVTLPDGTTLRTGPPRRSAA